MDESNQTARSLSPGAVWRPVEGGTAVRDAAPRVAGSPFAANTSALDACRLNPRVLHCVKDPALGVKVLGMDLAMPVIAAPLTGACRDAAGGFCESGPALGLFRGCAARGVAASVGDGEDDAVFETGLDVMRRSGTGGLCLLRPWEGPVLERRLQLAEAAGAGVVGIDVDAVALPGYHRAGRTLAPLSPTRLGRLARRAAVPLVVRGIMTPDEARLAVEAGACGIVVSNRGGRALGQCPGVAEVLPWIVEAVHGRAAIIAEGGVRSGVDVLKMLALGADAVMIGAPLEIAARGGGAASVEDCLDRLRHGLAQAMRLTGSARAASVRRSVLYVQP